jgi:hypothetical protein
MNDQTKREAQELIDQYGADAVVDALGQMKRNATLDHRFGELLAKFEGKYFPRKVREWRD